MIIKKIIPATLSDYDTAFLDDGTQIVIKRGQSEMIGKKVEINNGVVTEIKETPKKFIK